MLGASGHLLLPEFLPLTVRPGRPPVAINAGAQETIADIAALIEALLQAGEGNLYARVMDEVERVMFARVVGHTHGNQSEASAILGVSRATLRQRLRALGLTVDKVVTDDLRAGGVSGEPVS